MNPMKGSLPDAPGLGSVRDEGAGATNRRRLASFLRVTGWTILGCCVLFLGGFAAFATHVSGLSTPKDPPDADAIIVLTGGQARLDAALGLLKSGKGKRLLISGVHPSADSDDLRVATGGDRTLFSCCVDIDHAALDTIGNAEESAKWVRIHDYGKVILVTNNYHMPRSLLEMGRLLDKAELNPYPVVNSKLGDGGWMLRPTALRVLFTEYNKYLLALAGLLPRRATQDAIAVVDVSSAADG